MAKQPKSAPAEALEAEATAAAAALTEAVERGGEVFGEVASAPMLDAVADAREAAGGLAAALRLGSVIAGATHDVSQEWFAYAQAALRCNLDAMGDLARCRSLGELMDRQNDLLQRQLDEFAQTSARLTDRLMAAAHDAARPEPESSSAAA